MPSDGARLPGQYLLSQLGGGARPFPYRTGVYRLLGLPLQREERIGFRSPLLPVGFQYVQPQLGEAPWPVAPPSFPADEISFEVEAPPGPLSPAMPGERPVARHAAGAPADAGIWPQSEAHRAPRLNLPESGARTSASPLQTSDVVPPEAPQVPATKPRALGLAIPGISERPLVFPALARKSPVQDVSGPQEQVTLRPAIADAPSGPTAPPETDEKAGAPAAVAGGQTDARALNAQRAGFAPKHRQAAASLPEPALLRSRPRVAEQVEQLRQAVARLAARQAPPREEPREEVPSPRRASAPPAPREVMVVRQAARAGHGIPRSFWASSTLRSIHLGVLR
jgi:hypothetical protein